MWVIVQGLHLSWFVKFQLLPISSEKPNESCLIRVVMDDNINIMGVRYLEEEEEDLYLFRVAHSDALSTAINWGPDKN